MLAERFVFVGRVLINWATILYKTINPFIEALNIWLAQCEGEASVSVGVRHGRERERRRSCTHVGWGGEGQTAGCPQSVALLCSARGAIPTSLSCDAQHLAACSGLLQCVLSKHIPYTPSLRGYAPSDYYVCIHRYTYVYVVVIIYGNQNELYALNFNSEFIY